MGAVQGQLQKLVQGQPAAVTLADSGHCPFDTVGTDLKAEMTVNMFDLGNGLSVSGQTKLRLQPGQLLLGRFTLFEAVTGKLPESAKKPVERPAPHQETALILDQQGQLTAQRNLFTRRFERQLIGQLKLQSPTENGNRTVFTIGTARGTDRRPPGP